MSSTHRMAVRTDNTPEEAARAVAARSIMRLVFFRLIV